MDCPLCKAEKLTKRYYEDPWLWIADCLSHPDKKIVVLKRHTDKPMRRELRHMYDVVYALFRDKKWRGPNSIKEHFHLHET